MSSASLRRRGCWTNSTEETQPTMSFSGGSSSGCASWRRRRPMSEHFEIPMPYDQATLRALVNDIRFDAETLNRECRRKDYHGIESTLSALTLTVATARDVARGFRLEADFDASACCSCAAGLHR